MDNSAFLQQFLDEAVLHVETVEQGLMEIEKGSSNAETLRNIFRAVHSLKGSAGFFGFESIVTLSHVMEGLLGDLTEQMMPITPELIDILLAATDVLRALVSDVEKSDQVDVSQYVQAITAFKRGYSLAVADDDVQDADPPKAEACQTEIIMDVRSCPDEQENGVGEKPKHQASGEDSIRVSVGLLNDLLNLVSEMVLGRNQLLRYNMKLTRKNDANMKDLVQNIDYLTTELQDKVMQTRLQPMSVVFNKFPRVVRELSKRLGKPVQLTLEGTEVELDKSIIESLADPLTHLVRNSMDHGIERPEFRQQMGKEATGNILLKAYHEGGSVVIEITDDGAGIETEKVQQIALKKGLLSESNLALLSEQEILKLILQPNFSTASEITDLSGRGVGMDVVKTNIERLGGGIEIQTQVGQGTTFRLTLPITLAIVPSLIVGIAGHSFALPQINLQEIVRIKPRSFVKRELRKIEYIHDYPVLRLRGQLLPLVYLAPALGLENAGWRVPEERAINVLVIKIGTRRYGLVVDTVHDWEEILVKPLPTWLKTCKCYSGVTILGDGKVAMILDPDKIAEKGNLYFVEQHIRSQALSRGALPEVVEKKKNVLLFKCSGTELLGIDLSTVLRVEKVTAGSIEKIGEKGFYKYDGRALEAVNPEDYLPITKRQRSSDRLFVVVPKANDCPVGLVVNEIYNTVQIPEKLDNKTETIKGLPGSIMLDGRIVILLKWTDICETIKYTG